MPMIDRELNYGRHHIEAFLKKCGPFKTVLDIGAGPGTDLAIVRNIDPDVIAHAIEVSPERVVLLQDQRVHVHCLDIEQDRLPFADSSLDVVIANQVLEHVKNIFWLFHEVTRVLSIGGKLIIGVPNLASLHNRMLLAWGKQPTPLKNASAHVRGFTKSDMMHFLESCFPKGYMLRAFAGSNFYPFPPWMAMQLAALFPSMAWGIFFLFEKRSKYHREFLDYPVIHKLETSFYLGRS